VDAGPEVLGTTCPGLDAIDPWRDRVGAHTLADRGEIVACAHVKSTTRGDVAANPHVAQHVGAVTNGYETFVVQYISEIRAGIAGTVTALLYLPDGDTTNLPIAAVEHATTGLGPSCGVTRQPAAIDALAIPLVARGYAVVATDYGGLGVDNGMASYLFGAAEAAATLDAVRALSLFRDQRFKRERLGKDLFFIGHSQGGHAALFAHQAFDASLGFRLRGSVSFAPGFGDMREIAKSFRSGSEKTDAMTVFALLSLYSQMLYAGGPDPGTWLTPAAAMALPKLVHDTCFPTTLFSIAAQFPTQASLYQPAFLEAASRCSFVAPCPEFEPWSTRMLGVQPGDFASPAPVLILQGARDEIVSSPSAACIARRLAAKGTNVQGCSYAYDTHDSIVATAFPDAFRWMEALRGGASPSVCPAPLPAACPE
jgi:pimeloyl-ACP methyl ester carboxylesterase